MIEDITYCVSLVPTDDSGLQIDEDGAGHVFAGTSLTEESVEGVIATSNGLVAGHLAIRLDAVLQAVELPARVTDLNTGLSDMDGDAFALKKIKGESYQLRK